MAHARPTSIHPIPRISSVRRCAARARKRMPRLPLQRQRFRHGRVRRRKLRYDILKKASDEILARKDELGPAVVARGRQDAAGRRRRSCTRRPDLCVLCRRMPADGWRETRFRAPRHRHRDHARSAGRCRPDHAVEFPDRDSGLEDRAGAGLWQHRGDQARGPRPGFDLGAGRHPASRWPAQGRAEPRDRARL